MLNRSSSGRTHFATDLAEAAPANTAAHEQTDDQVGNVEILQLTGMFYRHCHDSFAETVRINVFNACNSAVLIDFHVIDLNACVQLHSPAAAVIALATLHEAWQSETQTVPASHKDFSFRDMCRYVNQLPSASCFL